MTKEDKEIAIIATTIQNIDRDVQEIKRKLDANYVTKAEFQPVKNLVYGLVALFGAAVVAAILKLILIQ
jgi:hypothetical protein